MKYMFQFSRILAICLLGEVLTEMLPFPVPESVYGLVILLVALKLGVCRLEQVKDTGHFLTSILPLLFLPATVGVMDMWSQLLSMLIPCLIAIVPVTLLVMGVTGQMTQRVRKSLKRRSGQE